MFQLAGKPKQAVCTQLGLLLREPVKKWLRSPYRPELDRDQVTLNLQRLPFHEMPYHSCWEGEEK